MGTRIYVEPRGGDKLVIDSKPDSTTGERYFEIGGALSAHLEGVIGTIRAILKRGEVRVTRVTVVNDHLKATVRVPSGHLIQTQSVRVYVHNGDDPSRGDHAAFHFSLECRGPLVFLRTLKQLTDPKLLQKLVSQAHPELAECQTEEVDDLVFDE